MRQANLKDLPVIMAMIADARQFLRQEQIDQWQQTYPASADITADIAAGSGYVLADQDQVVGYAAVRIGFDPVYQTISDGAWDNDSQSYVMIHRTVVSSQVRGQKLGQQLFKAIFATFSDETDFRCDTHPDNQIMQHILTKMGFEKRGIVEYESARIAYQKSKKEESMTYEQEFMKEFEDWVATQITVNEMAMAASQEVVETDDDVRAKDAVIRYESRRDAYRFLLSKFDNYKAGKGFHELPDGLFDQIKY
jgi:ribosomal protein S18 acetylase RimI-like enzyme